MANPKLCDLQMNKLWNLIQRSWYLQSRARWVEVLMGCGIAANVNIEPSTVQHWPGMLRPSICRLLVLSAPSANNFVRHAIPSCPISTESMMLDMLKVDQETTYITNAPWWRTPCWNNWGPEHPGGKSHVQERWWPLAVHWMWIQLEEDIPCTEPCRGQTCLNYGIFLSYMSQALSHKTCFDES